MGFIDSYKYLDKLCCDMLRNSRGISAYIDEMLSTPRGSYYVEIWDKDLKNLKHYRWVRNQISHEPGCTEQSMCEPEDTMWIEYFHARILNQTDPLSLYRKARRQSCDATPDTSVPSKSGNYKIPTRPNAGCAFIVMIALLVAAALVSLILFT